MKTFKLIGILSAELMRRISDRIILPFNSKSYANELINEFEHFESVYKEDFKNLNISLDDFRASVYNFSVNANDFHRRLANIDKKR